MCWQDLRAAFEADGSDGAGAQGQQQGARGTDGEVSGRRGRQRRKRPKAGEGVQSQSEGGPSSQRAGMAGVSVAPPSRLAVWEPLSIVGGDVVLRRWGHSVVQGGPYEAMVFGGYGYHGAWCAEPSHRHVCKKGLGAEIVRLCWGWVGQASSVCVWAASCSSTWARTGHGSSMSRAHGPPHGRGTPPVCCAGWRGR